MGFQTSILVIEDWKVIVDKYWKDSINNQRTHPFEYQVISKNGDVVWIYQNCNTIVDLKGKPVAIEGIMSDITNTSGKLHHSAVTAVL